MEAHPKDVLSVVQGCGGIHQDTCTPCNMGGWHEVNVQAPGSLKTNREELDTGHRKSDPLSFLTISDGGGDEGREADQREYA